MAGDSIKTMDQSGANATNPSASRLTPVEAEVIELFVQFSRALGQPRSVAEIYGLLFVSHLPLTLHDLKERLNISMGSTSQGLQFLQELGAVRAVEMPHSRRTHYTAVAELRKLAGNFLSSQISTHLSDTGDRLERITEQAGSLTGEARKHTLKRLDTLKVWQYRSQKTLPFLLKMLGGR